ncbi:hypothetical protein Mterra_00890 [Calidithermus terrae]|uniref:Uncharacterized protein n=1 Tax=Calidithermus terrae TaxID=1408545 RepID=A0A399F0W5_9DEIN|nr:hypothetical protein Mterra_00890 [Calidithermus terrae]
MIKKAARQPTVSTITPPTSGPSSVVAEDAADQTPMARPCSPSENPARISASEPGTSRAPATPCNSRPRISTSMLGASPHRAEVTPKPTSPTAYIRLRP